MLYHVKKPCFYGRPPWVLWLNPHESLPASPKVRPKSRNGSLAAAERPTAPPWHVRWAQHHPGGPSPKSPLRNLAFSQGRNEEKPMKIYKIDHETIGQQNIMLTR